MEVAFYSPSPGDRIRIAVHYGDSWCPIFWLEVERDGSVYLGPRYINITTLRKGSKPLHEGSVAVKYEEGQEVIDPRLLKSPKVSFHASGVVHAAGDHLFRDSLRTVKEQQELCRILFQHPSQYAPITEIRKRDICLNYRFDEQRPLQGLIFVAPSDKVRIVQVPSATNQVTLLLPFSGLRIPDLVLQFILGHGPMGPWPPYSYILFGNLGMKHDETS